MQNLLLTFLGSEQIRDLSRAKGLPDSHSPIKVQRTFVKATQRFLLGDKYLFSGSHISQINLQRQEQWNESHSVESQAGLAAVLG